MIISALVKHELMHISATALYTMLPQNIYSSNE